MKNLMGHIHTIKQQVIGMSMVKVISSEIKEDFEEYIKIVHPKTLISWTLNLVRPSGNNIRPQLYYCSSSRRDQKSSDFVPGDGIHIHHNGNTATVELRFLVEGQEDHDEVLLKIPGKWRGKSLIAVERL